MPWKRMLAYITGSVNEDLLRRIEYLLEENRVLRHQIEKRILLTDHERRTLAEKAVALGKLMADTVTIVSPQTRSSNGTSDWSPGSSTALDFGSGTGAHRSILNWRNSHLVSLQKRLFKLLRHLDHYARNWRFSVNRGG